MNVANPYYLYALAGLAIPVAIHLWNRKQGKVIIVGSIKLFNESDTNKMNSIKLSELLLLLLRLLMIVLITLIMSGLSFLPEDSQSQKVLTLIDPEYTEREEIKELIDLEDDEHDLRVFQRGFPVLEAMKTSSVADHWTLINKVKSLDYDSVVIYSPLRLMDFVGDWQQVPNHISIVSLPENPSDEFIERAIWVSSDSIKVFLGTNENNQITYSKAEIEVTNKQFNVNPQDSTISIKNSPDEVKIELMPKLKVGVYAHLRYKEDIKYFESALKTLEAYDIATFEITEFEEDQAYDLLIWFDAQDDSFYQRVKVRFPLILSAQSRQLITKTGTNVYSLNSRVNPLFTSEEQLLKLPQSIFNILIETKLIHSYGSRNDLRSFDANDQLLQSNENVKKEKLASIDLSTENINDYWLWIMFLLLFALERILSINKVSQS